MKHLLERKSILKVFQYHTKAVLYCRLFPLSDAISCSSSLLPIIGTEFRLLLNSRPRFRSKLGEIHCLVASVLYLRAWRPMNISDWHCGQSNTLPWESWDSHRQDCSKPWHNFVSKLSNKLLPLSLKYENTQYYSNMRKLAIIWLAATSWKSQYFINSTPSR